jgi:hypothetical protein
MYYLWRIKRVLLHGSQGIIFQRKSSGKREIEARFSELQTWQIRFKEEIARITRVVVDVGAVATTDTETSPQIKQMCL